MILTITMLFLREIDSQNNLKPEPLFEEEKTSIAEQGLVNQSIETMSNKNTEGVENKHIQSEGQQNICDELHETTDADVELNRDNSIHDETVEDNTDVLNNDKIVEDEGQMNIDAIDANDNQQEKDDVEVVKGNQETPEENKKDLIEHHQEEPMEIEEILKSDAELGKISDQSEKQEVRGFYHIFL